MLKESSEAELVCNGSSHVANGYSKNEEDSNVRKRKKEPKMKNADETKEYSHKESHAPLKEKEIKVLEFN